MSSEDDFHAGRYGQPYGGSDWDAYQRGMNERQLNEAANKPGDSASASADWAATPAPTSYTPAGSGGRYANFGFIPFVLALLGILGYFGVRDLQDRARARAARSAESAPLGKSSVCTQPQPWCEPNQPYLDEVTHRMYPRPPKDVAEQLQWRQRETEAAQSVRRTK